MCNMKSTIGKSIDLEVTNDNIKYSMCKIDKTKQRVKLTKCVSLIEPINYKIKQLDEYLNLSISLTFTSIQASLLVNLKK